MLHIEPDRQEQRVNVKIPSKGVEKSARGKSKMEGITVPSDPLQAEHSPRAKPSQLTYTHCSKIFLAFHHSRGNTSKQKRICHILNLIWQKMKWEQRWKRTNTYEGDGISRLKKIRKSLVGLYLIVTRIAR